MALWALLLTTLTSSLLSLLLFSAAAAVISRRRGRRRAAGFFHPYTNDGGGGERVLWCAVKAVQEENPDLHCAVFTGDDASPQSLSARALDRFGVKLLRPPQVVRLYRRKWIEEHTYPHFTMIGQSLGSVYLSWEALRKFTPQFYFDTSGYAFTYPLARIFGCKVICYTHYPTISRGNRGYMRGAKQLDTEPIEGAGGQALRGGVVTSEDGAVEIGVLLLHGLDGAPQDPLPAAAVNGHRGSSGERRQQQRRAAATAAASDDSDSGKGKGSGRHEQREGSREARAAGGLEGGASSGKACGRARGRHEQREGSREARAAGGLERGASNGKARGRREQREGSREARAAGRLLAAGVIPIAHNSAGPKMDIVLNEGGHRTGFLASSKEEYAEAILKVLKMPEPERLAIAAAARKRAQRFSEQKFFEDFEAAVQPILAPKASS
ncbi:GDP-Man:Man(3)GlcNAc(2)-PP-Dol alpha-1,2-mannosyltransferase-like [Musa acuminata AAA Group]|uniref:GDP-Man:Man(3)GlcNAc(2)-PP-Dol alpha-1,2-mannosyltransferase-like n=1 Tax=Musa acuminata AAA Group TaxID=214697 RepID=UPI0031E4728C